jgi:4,5:9,10-diseco-3-hydroxy-5,9,17-trioxoandrosta-1(10),2-diene-4-oate hydrolase
MNEMVISSTGAGAGAAGRLRAAAGVPMGSPRVVVDGVGLAVSRQGKGPPLVCLHAIGHGGADFDSLAAAVSARFEVIRVDWPGQGRSGEDSEPASPKRYAQLLEGVLSELGVRNPIVLGCSIGGAAALLYARRRPTRALVLCNSGGLIPVTANIRRATSWFAGVFDAGARGAWWYKAFWNMYYRFLVLPSAAAAEQRRRIVDAAHEIAPVVAQAFRSFGRPDADLRELAAELDVPVWVAWATGDRLNRLGLCLPAIRRMRQASLTRFGGGHAAFLERPQEFVEGLLKFCARLGPAPL